MTNIFIVWTKYQARVETLKEVLNENLGKTEVVYRENPPAKPFRKILLYLEYFFKDLKYLISNKPERIFIQTPPSYALLAPIVYKIMFKNTTKIVCDMHNAMTRRPWISRAGTKFLIKKCDLIIVHNEIVYENILEQDLFNYYNKEKILILEDKTPKFATNSINQRDSDRPLVFFPASFNNDEPIEEVINAAKLIPEFDLVMTGNYKKLKENFNITQESLPSNIKITGWIPTEDYNKLLLECDILLGLTIFDDIQMSVSNEGLGAKKVMVLSDKKALRQIYSDGALYTENKANAIAENLKNAFHQSNNLILKINKVSEKKESRYDSQLNEVLNTIN